MFGRRATWCLALTLLSSFQLAASQDLPSSYPHVYAGKPAGDYSPLWQKYFQVTAPLPNVTFPVGRSFAGNLPVNRANHPNNTLFFFGFEKSSGSLTAVRSPAVNNNPWGIWLNGGPGSSSMIGLFTENGPIQIKGDYSAAPNQYSWDKLADYFWIDQPVGTGYSTADANGYAPDEDQIGKDFMGFLSNLVKVFPSLATRPLHLTGESYAGQYIPYILKAYFDMPNPPVKIAKIAMGDGTYTSEQSFELLTALSVLQTYPQIIGYDQAVFNYFKQQTHLCHFDVNLTYPQNGIIPDPVMIFPTEQVIPFYMKRKSLKRTSLLKEIRRRGDEESRSLVERDAEERQVAKEVWKRDLSLRANGTIDPWYGCFLLDMFIDYALNYTFPWNLPGPDFPFDVYNIPDALNPKVPADPTVFMNDPRTRAALHAPTSKDWVESFDFPFGANENDASAPAINIFNDLAKNATAKGVGIVFYSGNDDALIPHWGTEIAIQNTTFGDIQGFTRKPSTPWYSDSGKPAGVVHQERGWTYVLVTGAGHLIPRDAPDVAFTFLREFVLGNNQAGLVKTSKPGVTTVVGGEDKSLEGIIQGSDDIYYGPWESRSTYLAPAATRAAWKTFINGASASAPRRAEPPEPTQQPQGVPGFSSRILRP